MALSSGRFQCKREPKRLPACPMFRRSLPCGISPGSQSTDSFINCFLMIWMPHFFFLTAQIQQIHSEVFVIGRKCFVNMPHLMLSSFSFQLDAMSVPPTVDDLAINRILSECSLHKHCCTSAATGEGIDGLVSSLIHSLPWERLIRITAPRALQHTREFILKAKEVGTILISADEIKEGVKRVSLDEGISKEQIATVISLLQASGLIYQLTSEAVETLVLLRPEKINQYASSIITAARNHPSGIGAVSERDVLVGKIPFIGFERLSTAEERIVLGACRRNSIGSYFMLIWPHYGKDFQIL